MYVAQSLGVKTMYSHKIVMVTMTHYFVTGTPGLTQIMEFLVLVDPMCDILELDLSI